MANLNIILTQDCTVKGILFFSSAFVVGSCKQKPGVSREGKSCQSSVCKPVLIKGSACTA